MQPHRKSHVSIRMPPVLLLYLLLFLPYTESIRPNILLILADDLGYGDTSVSPFTGTGIHTPELQRMAEASLVYTNFHAAAPVCTPTRASILTGLFPWRVGAFRFCHSFHFAVYLIILSSNSISSNF